MSFQKSRTQMICTKSLLNSEFFLVSSYFFIYAAFAEVKAATCLVYVGTQLLYSAFVYSQIH